MSFNADGQDVSLILYQLFLEHVPPATFSIDNGAIVTEAIVGGELSGTGIGPRPVAI